MSRDPPHDADGDVPSLERTLRILAADRRRETLSYLFDSDGDAVAVEELAEEVADGDATERAYQSLHHAHLPKLDDAGIVSYERRDERVSLAGDQSRVEELLAATDAVSN
ncbi:DUF7344 domain-containing protein [Halorussus aquaticus]